MIAAAGVENVLATGRVQIVDLVTLTIRRGRCHQFDGGGYFNGVKEIEDSVRWTSATRSLRTSAMAKDGGQVYEPLSGVAYQRGTLQGSLGAEVLQISMSVSGALPIYLSTAQDGSGSFATSLMELALLGMLDGSRLTIDQAVVYDLPMTPVAAGAGYGVLSPDPVRVFDGVIRGAKPSSHSVEFEACDVLIQGGGSVPRNLFSPLCRWEFATGASQGVGCPVPRRLGASRSHMPIPGSDVVFETATTVKLTPSVVVSLYAMAWCYIVPQDGPMMGMRFQVGSLQNGGANGNRYDFADRLPWAWSCTMAHLEAACSKSFDPATNGETAYGCQEWDIASSNMAGTVTGAVKAAFGGFPDMPEPENA